jgi:hypothetical protein
MQFACALLLLPLSTLHILKTYDEESQLTKEPLDLQCPRSKPSALASTLSWTLACTVPSRPWYFQKIEFRNICTLSRESSCRGG